MSFDKFFVRKPSKETMCMFKVRGRVYENSSNTVGISYLYPSYYVVHGNASVTHAAL